MPEENMVDVKISPGLIKFTQAARFASRSKKLEVIPNNSIWITILKPQNIF